MTTLNGQRNASLISKEWRVLLDLNSIPVCVSQKGVIVLEPRGEEDGIEQTSGLLLIGKFRWSLQRNGVCGWVYLSWIDHKMFLVQIFAKRVLDLSLKRQISNEQHLTSDIDCYLHIQIMSWSSIWDLCWNSTSPWTLEHPNNDESRWRWSQRVTRMEL